MKLGLFIPILFILLFSIFKMMVNREEHVVPSLPRNEELRAIALTRDIPRRARIY